jgi:hypothetical protein
MREGPLAYASPESNPDAGLIEGYAGGGLMGSGVLDYAAIEQLSGSDFGVMYSFDDRPGPGWHPNDNTLFYVPKQLAPTVMSGTGWGPQRSDDVSRMLVLTVPAGMYGRRITPNSVKITDNAFSDGPYGLIRTLIDDGRGGLFLSGSAVSSSLDIGDPGVVASGSYTSSTSSIVFEAQGTGPSWDGIGVTSTVFGVFGDPDFHINETDPFNIILTVPCEFDGVTPSSTFWDLYTFIASSSDYMQSRSIEGNYGDLTGLATWTLAGGQFGTSTVPPVRRPTPYRGVEWNKVGNVFYDEGIVVIKDPSLLDFGASWPSYSNDDHNILEFSFRGDSRIPVKTMMCRIDRGDLNASLNKTFWTEEEDGDRVRRHPSGSMYVTTVGIYNSDHELVGVARLAEPLRVRPRDRMNVKLRLDF